MLDQIIVTIIDISLVLFGAVVVVLLYAANEIGFRIGTLACSLPSGA